MLKSETRVFEGPGDTPDITIEVTQLPGIKGRKLLVRLYKVLGPSFAALIEGGEEGTSVQQMTAKGGVPEIDMVSVSKALVTLSSRLREEDMEHLCKTMGVCSRVQLGESDWTELNDKMQNLIFAGRYLEMFKWLGFALEVNFGGFFAGLGGAESVFRTLVQKSPAPPSNSPNTLTGKSGESTAPNDIATP